MSNLQSFYFSSWHLEEEAVAARPAAAEAEDEGSHAHPGRHHRYQVHQGFDPQQTGHHSRPRIPDLQLGHEERRLVVKR